MSLRSFLNSVLPGDPFGKPSGTYYDPSLAGKPVGEVFPDVPVIQPPTTTGGNVRTIDEILAGGVSWGELGELYNYPGNTVRETDEARVREVYGIEPGSPDWYKYRDSINSGVPVVRDPQTGEVIPATVSGLPTSAVKNSYVILVVVLGLIMYALWKGTRR